MRFDFKLEGLLRVRKLLETQARDRLDESMMRIQALEHTLTEAHNWSESTARVLAAKGVLPACELQFADSVLHQAREGIRQCELRKKTEEQLAAELRASYMKARRGRKTISTLRENSLRLFQIEQARREQSALDEMFLGKMIHARNSNRKVSKATSESTDAKDSMTEI